MAVHVQGLQLAAAFFGPSAEEVGQGLEGRFQALSVRPACQDCYVKSERAQWCRRHVDEELVSQRRKQVVAQVETKLLSEMCHVLVELGPFVLAQYADKPSQPVIELPGVEAHSHRDYARFRGELEDVFRNRLRGDECQQPRSFARAGYEDAVAEARRIARRRRTGPLDSVHSQVADRLPLLVAHFSGYGLEERLDVEEGGQRGLAGLELGLQRLISL